MKKRIRGRLKRKRGPVQAKKVVCDGIKFASGLEKYMYLALKKAKIKAKYEGKTYIIQEGFEFDNQSYERQSNGKGEFKNRGNKKILPIKYTPDFVSGSFIKGFFKAFNSSSSSRAVCMYNIASISSSCISFK